MTSPLRLLAAAAAVVLLAGCAQPAPAAPVGAPSVPPSVTPTPTATAVANAQPDQLFGGDCAAVATDAQMSKIFGEAVVARKAFDSVENPKAAYEEQRGALECSWMTAKQGWGAVVLVLPEAAAPVGASACRNSGIEAGGQYSCAIETVLSGVQVSGLLWGSGSSNKATVAATKAFTAVLAASAAATSAVALPVLPEGSWSHPMNCEATLIPLDFTAIYGAGTAAWEDGVNDGYYPPALRALWGGSSGSCVVFKESEMLSVQWLGGGRWAESTVRAREDAEVIELEGIELAITSPAAYGGVRLDVFDGPNWLSAVFFDDDADVEAVQLIVSTLDHK
ncbi:hypothetical protein EYE40_00380 [Glaciihabitans arcticus]|uniref:DUF3558 domain-containing protein n=1 Tax=Glaciihabitans arcticus TaxID=2668039 RepID=A0A4Q9GMW0_9MICO|nr:hypothetical protein [Glaciihabitans arcticus]TBN55975.1 hypothetical protein EYE40_00380 [Glaciihabitans arcticus]